MAEELAWTLDCQETAYLLEKSVGPDRPEAYVCSIFRHTAEVGSKGMS